MRMCNSLLQFFAQLSNSKLDDVWSDLYICQDILLCYVKKCTCHATCSHNDCSAQMHLHHHNSKSSFWWYQGSIAEAAGYNEETVIVGRALQKDFEQRGVHLDSHRQHQALQMSEDIATLGMDISMQSCLLSHYAVLRFHMAFDTVSEFQSFQLCYLSCLALSYQTLLAVSLSGVM